MFLSVQDCYVYIFFDQLENEVINDRKIEYVTNIFFLNTEIYLHTQWKKMKNSNY